MDIRFGSVCSGIEAASVAWEPLGWRAAWLSEIEKFPSAVLAHHWPDVPNLGDMTTIVDRIGAGEIEAPEVFTGGTPCQAFSVAGKRESLSDERGNLTLEFVRIADAIDNARRAGGQPESVIMWENVPGVLNTKDNAFGCFLAGLAGEAEPLQPSGKRWTNAGCVFGPQRAVAWRVLDAQYFGVAQRRRRVFVVASARDGFDPTAVLFEREGVRRDTAPSREAREEAARAVAVRTANTSSNGWGISVEGPSYTLDAAGGGQAVGCWWDGGQVSQTLDAVLHKGQTMPEKNRFPAVLQPANDNRPNVLTVHGTQDPDVCDDHSHPLGRNSGQENAVYQPAMAVRRLTPVECERLQGFPDNHTAIPWRNKPADQCPDGPRYKAIGNSWAVPCARWIGERIECELNSSQNKTASATI
ncbi:DNA cytosine methyltransferase [Litorivivens sp.]|uniref:DNA cytosine methyltransferase n=1 Tax=Litorivivens sp. TaxID=2020868 RepID=UPI00356200B7